MARNPTRTGLWPSRLRNALVAALAGSALLAHAAPLTLDQALALAQAHSRQLPAQDAAAAAARDMAVAAGQRPDPVLKAGLNSLPVNGPDRFSLVRDNFTMLSLGIAQELTRSRKLQARSARYRREAELAEAGQALALARLQRDTAAAWLERHFLERMREALLAQREEAALQIESADSLYRSGRGAQADLFVARSGLAQVDDRIAQTEHQIATATTQLGRWLGAAAASQALAAPPPLDATRLQAEGLEVQLANHPQLALLAGQEAIAQAEVELAQANRQADVSVELSYSQRAPAYSNMLSLNLSLPLQWDQPQRQDRELAARMSVLTQLRAEREEALRGLASEALVTLQEWHSQRQRLGRYDATLLPLAAERRLAAIAAYRGGGGPLAAVLEARRSEIETGIDRLRLESDAARLWAQLLYLGHLGHLGPAGQPPSAAARP